MAYLFVVLWRIRDAFGAPAAALVSRITTAASRRAAYSSIFFT
jgi:hypothetical protein